MKRLWLALIAIAAAFAASGADDPTNYTLNEPKLFTAPSGVTNVYSGVISGTSYAIIEGGGTVAFSNPNNTYTGGTLVSNAVFRLDADGCAGSGAITAAVNTAHVYMNCANVPNDMYFCANYTTDYAEQKPTDYPNANSHPLFALAESVLVSGNVVCLGTGRFFYTTGTSTSGFSNPTVTFTGDFTSPNKARIEVLPYGTTIFKGIYSSEYRDRRYIGVNSTAQGTVEFHSPSNRINAAALYNANVYLKAKDALPYSLLINQNGLDYLGKLYLCGNDQTFRGVSWGTETGWPQPGEASTGQCWLSEDDPSTVRIIGCASNTAYQAGGNPTYVNRLALFGKITLVMDVAKAYTDTGFFQDFSVRKSTTTGDLIISNGDFRVTSTASFPNVPNIYVGSGGKFSNASTTPGAFAGCRNLTVLGEMSCTGDAAPFTDGAVSLTLGAGAEFSLPAGATMTVSLLKVGDTTYTEGTFGDGATHIDEILQGTVVIRSHDRYVDCNTTDTVNDGSRLHPHKTIKAATDNAIPGDVIHVAPGTYGDAEGSQAATETSTVETRVIIPEEVTIIGTEGAEKTFIVGAAATGNQIDNTTYGTGTNAIRCVYAKEGAVLRGFTLTGGRAVGASPDYGKDLDKHYSAFFSPVLLGATIEDCIVSNNAAFRGSCYRAVVKRCRVIGNAGTRNGGYDRSSPAGYTCSWYDTIIDGNSGNAVVDCAYAFENCTVGSANTWSAGGDPIVLYYWGAGNNAIVNSAVLGGRYNAGGGAKLYCTNCLVMANQIGTVLKREQSHNTIFTNSAAAKVDSEYRPILGEFAGIDAGDASYSTDARGDRDIHGTPRILNGVIDIGAVEYDWRPTFNAELGRRFSLTYASPTVTTNATGGVKLDGNAGALGDRALPVCVAGTATSEGPYEILFDVTGGSLAVYVGGELAGESFGAGEQSIRLNVQDAAAEIRFTFTPDAENPGAAVLRKFAGARGFSIRFR